MRGTKNQSKKKNKKNSRRADRPSPLQMINASHRSAALPDFDLPSSGLQELLQAEATVAATSERGILQLLLSAQACQLGAEQM